MDLEECIIILHKFFFYVLDTCLIDQFLWLLVKYRQSFKYVLQGGGGRYKLFMLSLKSCFMVWSHIHLKLKASLLYILLSFSHYVLGRLMQNLLQLLQSFSGFRSYLYVFLHKITHLLHVRPHSFFRLCPRVSHMCSYLYDTFT